MFNKKRLLSSVLAGLVMMSSVNAVSFSAFAADDENKIVMTFDGKYDMEDIVDSDFFLTENDYEVDKKLREIIARKAGVKDVDVITYGDLAKITVLDLGGLELTDVPSCINYMTNLARLDLSSNLLQSDALKKLSLLGCTKLSNINLSDNYLTAVPSWFVSDRVKNGNITKNFVDSTARRYLISNQPTYYLMDGETVDEDSLKNQILKSIRFNDNTLLPEMFFEYNGEPAYPNVPEYYPYQLDIAEWNVPITEGKVVAPANKTVDVTVKLFKDIDNANTVVTVKVHLLNGTDLASYKKRLASFVAECETLSKDKYTESTWTNFSYALDTAKAILEYENADIQMLINAYDSLSKAKDKLHYGIKELDAMIKSLVAVGGKYKKDDFTPVSWQAFSNAYEELKAISTNKNATLETAENAVKRFQSAQAKLVYSTRTVPDKILKEEFQKIFGEDTTITSKGTTYNGTPYTWVFDGRDLTTIADFVPEVKDTDTAETDIMIEAGSASNYRMFATVATGEFPGKATLKLDVSDKFMKGNYYLYKWDSSAKRSAFSGNVTVTDGIAQIPLTEGGVYYICPNFQNFVLKSEVYVIDDSKMTLSFFPRKVTTVSVFKNNIDYGSYTTVLDENGKTVSAGSLVRTGMTINAPNMDKYTISVLGDVDMDGVFSTSDLKYALELFVGDEISEKESIATDLDQSSSFTTSDLMLLLESFVNN